MEKTGTNKRRANPPTVYAGVFTTRPIHFNASGGYTSLHDYGGTPRFYFSVNGECAEQPVLSSGPVVLLSLADFENLMRRAEV